MGFNKMMRRPEAAAYLNCSKSFLDKLAVTGGGPKMIRLSRRLVAYEQTALDEWVAIRRVESTNK